MKCAQLLWVLASFQIRDSPLMDDIWQQYVLRPDNLACQWWSDSSTLDATAPIKLTSPVLLFSCTHPFHHTSPLPLMFCPYPHAHTTGGGKIWARGKVVWTNFEALPRTKYFLQF